MQTQNPFLDEMAKLSAAAMGLAQAAGEEAKAAFAALERAIERGYVDIADSI